MNNNGIMIQDRTPCVHFHKIHVTPFINTSSPNPFSHREGNKERRKVINLMSVVPTLKTVTRTSL